MKRWVLGLGLAWLIVVAPGFGVSAEEPLRVGLLAPLSGRLEAEGKEAKQVLELLVARINDSGGVLKQPLELVVEDDADDPQNAVAAARRILGQKVIAVIGGYASAITEAVQPVFDAAGVVQVSPASTAVPLTQQGYRRFFRVCSRDDHQAPVIVEAIGRSGAKRVAVLQDESLYSRRLAVKALQLLKREAGREAAVTAIAAGAEDFTEILKALKAAQADALLLTDYYPEVGRILRQSRELGWTVPVFGTDAANNPELVTIAGIDAARGFCFSSMPLPENLPALEAKRFLVDYQARYGKPLHSVFALLAGDALQAVVFAIGKTGSNDSAAVAAYLHDGLKDFVGMSGQIAFDPQGDREAPLYVTYCLDQGGAPQLMF